MKNLSCLIPSLHSAVTPVMIATMLAGLLTGCAPSHDWREIHGDTAPFTVLLPAKPTIQMRQLTLAGVAVTMKMTAAEVDHATYAVGCVETADPASAKKVMLAMKAALIGHVDGAIVKEQATDAANESQVDLEAIGTPKGESRVVVARFVARDRFAYQAIVTGPSKEISRDQIDTFMTSFKVK